MEIIDRGDDPGAEEAQIAYVETREEAELVHGLLEEAAIPSYVRPLRIEGPTIGAGLLTSTPGQIFVRAGDAVAARKLLGETMVEEPSEEIPEPANARYLSGAGSPGLGAGSGRRVRDYSILGAYARAYLVAIAVAGLALALFLLVLR